MINTNAAEKNTESTTWKNNTYRILVSVELRLLLYLHVSSHLLEIATDGHMLPRSSEFYVSIFFSGHSFFATSCKCDRWTAACNCYN